MEMVVHHENCMSHEDDNYCDCDFWERLEREQEEYWERLEQEEYDEPKESGEA